MSTSTFHDIIFSRQPGLSLLPNLTSPAVTESETDYFVICCEIGVMFGDLGATEKLKVVLSSEMDKPLMPWIRQKRLIWSFSNCNITSINFQLWGVSCTAQMRKQIRGSCTCSLHVSFLEAAHYQPSVVSCDILAHFDMFKSRQSPYTKLEISVSAL